MEKILFSELKTVSGYSADLVISALQKEIRRGNLEPACFFALELIESGEAFESKLWERLQVIVVEDVSDTGAICAIKALKDTYYGLADAKPCDRHMQALKAVQILCQSKKDRIVSEIYDFLRIKRKAGHKIPIPDYAIDMHTKKGKELGRGYYHFLEESSRINNIARNKDFKYLKELKKYAKRGIRP